MSRLKKVLADENSALTDIRAIENNPDNGVVIWTCLNNQNKGVFVSYNKKDKQFLCFDNFDENGLTTHTEVIKLNRKSLKDRFDVAKQKAKKMVKNLTIDQEHGFNEKEILSLDNFVTKKNKNSEETISNYIPNIEQMITRYVPEDREEGETIGHIYGIYYDDKSNMLIAMNIDNNGSVISQEFVNNDKQQDTFNKIEETIIKAMNEDAQWYRRDDENPPQDLGLMIDINLSPWTKFESKQVEEKQEEKQEKEQEKQEEPELSQEKIPEYKEQKKEKPKKDKKNEDHLYSTDTKTISILYENKDSAIINEFAATLNNDKLIIGYEILPGYTYKKSSLSHILTSLALLKYRIIQQSINKTACLRKNMYSFNKSRLRKIAYNYVDILNELANDLVVNTNGIDVASVYFTKETNNATDSAACGFIIIYDNKYIAFGPNASNDIVAIDTSCIEELRIKDPSADVNNPKIDMNNFVSKAESMKLNNIKIFNSSIDAEQWINQINNNNIKSRIILNHDQLFNDTDDYWDNIDGLGDRPDLNPEDIKVNKPEKEKEKEKEKEESESEQQKWTDLPENERTWQLRITYKNWPTAIKKIRDFIDSNPNVIKNKKEIII